MSNKKCCILVAYRLFTFSIQLKLCVSVVVMVANFYLFRIYYHVCSSVLQVAI